MGKKSKKKKKTNRTRRTTSPGQFTLKKKSQRHRVTVGRVRTGGQKKMADTGKRTYPADTKRATCSSLLCLRSDESKRQEKREITRSHLSEFDGKRCARREGERDKREREEGGKSLLEKCANCHNTTEEKHSRSWIHPRDGKRFRTRTMESVLHKIKEREESGQAIHL